ncbi:MAG TPA: hypothetical protein VK358_01650 [Longimicrobium sp.]|nr:hypothetical protein [Longimicrobium sp.]
MQTLAPPVTRIAAPPLSRAVAVAAGTAVESDSLIELAELLALMNNNPSTNKWDVVCSYTLDSINAYLQAEQQASPLPSTLTLKTSLSFFGQTYPLTYDLVLGTPLLSFSAAQSGVATLTIPIEPSSTWSAPTAPVTSGQVPTGLSVQITTPLGAVTGAEMQTPLPSQTQITFEGTGSQSYQIVLDFATGLNGTTAKISIVPPPPPDAQDVWDTTLLPALTTYLSELRNVYYVLGAVSDTPPPAGTLALTPKSFAFDTWASADGMSGVLSIFIQTHESNNPPGAAGAPFEPGNGNVVSPVPSGYTASLILSNQLIKQFITNQLTRGSDPQWDSVTFEQPANRGLMATLSSPQPIFSNASNNDGWWGSYNYDGVETTFDKNPVQLTIADGNLSVCWPNPVTLSSGWTQTVVGAPNPTYGTVYVTISLNSTPTPFASDTDTSLIAANFTLSASDFTYTTSAKGCKWYSTGCAEYIPSYYDQITFSVPSIGISLPDLNYFATTNVLSPGQTVISINSQTGVQTPCDFLLLGNVVNNTAS